MKSGLWYFFLFCLHMKVLTESQLCCQLKFWLPIGCATFVVVCIFGCILICWLTKKKYSSTVHDPNGEYMFMRAVNTAKKSRLTDVTV
ncbi:inducible T-cell costimulator isoform X3 [Macaca fascicularis]|uniref:inducible T-cell costimulator isoform X3 n=1 Tax=Macaca fascicularis TaxID=9541 RepID=UPI003D15EB3A